MARDAAYRKAVEKVETARRSGAKELNLSAKYDSDKLIELPEVLARLTQLGSLDLSGNQLTSLPEALGQLTQLEKLDLSGNQLASLPEALRKLTQLEKLDLSSNRLTSLPEALSKLTQLKELGLSSNRLTSLPEALSKLTQLKELGLSFNQLVSLPEALSKLTQLEKLDLSSNRLVSSLETLGQLTQLKEMDLSSNQLTLLPEALSKLTQLKELGLSSNRLTSLPEVLSKLTQLEKLGLSYNQLKSLPEALGQLAHLQSLNLSYNQLTVLPEALGHLAQLEELDLSGNQLASLPEVLGQLMQLGSLDLSGNQLASLPKALDKLAHLRSLNLSYNQLKALPETLGELTQLKELDLSSNQLASLPEALRKLTQLEKLDLSGNQLTVLPEALGQLTQLEKLDLSGNQLASLPEALGQLTQLQSLALRGNRLTVLPKSLDLLPGNIAILNERAWHQCDLRCDQYQYGQAIEVLDQVLARDPTNVYALCWRIGLLRTQGNFKDAQHAIDKALGRDPADIAVLNERAWLDPALKRELPITRSNTGELAIKFVQHEDAKTNAMFAGTHARGGANSFLWISEWGVIQSTDLARSEEILTGALPSVGDGVCVVESTWRGGRNGHLWSLVKSALETPEEEKGPLDWRVAFFPWRDESAYSDAVPRPIGEETERYFAGLPASAGEFSPGQMSRYQRKRAELGMFVLREFPTVMEECFQAPVEGAIYAAAIDKLRVEGAIKPWIVDHSALVHTAWDLGSPVNTAVWYFQIVANEIRVIDCDLDLDIPPVERVSRMIAKGYLYGSHFLPHDALATQKSGRTFLNELKEAGLPNCRAVPRTHDIWVGINRLRQMLPRFSFRVPQCERGLEALSNYHTIRETSTGIARDEPCHDWSSHAADSARVLAEAEAANMLRGAAGGVGRSAYRGGVQVLTGFRGGSARQDREESILDRFFGPEPNSPVRVIR